MKEPKVVSKAEPDERSVAGALAAQSTLLQLVIGICVVVVIAVVGGGYALYHQMTLLDRRVASLQRSMQAGIDRVSTLTSGNSTGIVALLKEHGSVDQKLTRIESTVAPKASTAPSPIASLSPTETAGLRALFSLVRHADASPRFKLGDKIPATDLKPVPENVYQAIPRLQGTNFLIDQNGALVVTAGADNSVILIVEPA
jgi:hypothetical protein